MLGNIADSRSQTIEEHLNQSSSTIRKSEKELPYILSKRLGLFFAFFLRMIQGQLKLLEDALNEEKLKRHKVRL